MGLILICTTCGWSRTFCDRVLVMYAGRVVEELPAGGLHDARHPYTRGLLACLPRIGGSRATAAGARAPDRELEAAAGAR